MYIDVPKSHKTTSASEASATKRNKLTGRIVGTTNATALNLPKSIPYRQFEPSAKSTNRMRHNVQAFPLPRH